MCDMSTYYPNNAGYVSGPTPHDQYNGEAHHHHVMSGCQENGRGPPLQQYHHMQYGAGQQTYPRFPPFDRMEVKPCPDGTNAAEPSPYYNCGTNAAPAPHPPPNAPQPPPPPHQQPVIPIQYDSCGGRGSITPPHESQQYSSCKMQQPMHPHNDGLGPGLPNMMAGSPPSPHHPQHHQMYPSAGPVGSPNQQNSNSAISSHSPLYPWMRSQFGS